MGCASIRGVVADSAGVAAVRTAPRCGDGVSRSDQAVHLSTGVDVRYVAQGDPSGVPVLLLHAWGESMGCFDRLTSMMPTTIRVLAMDQRRHGDSDKPADAYSLTDFAGDVTAFLDAMGLPSAVLVGSSSGGYVAQQVAITSPERVRGLVLVGAPRSLHGRAPFADEVDQLTDPIDRTWMKDSLTWFLDSMMSPSGTSRPA